MSLGEGVSRKTVLYMRRMFHSKAMQSLWEMSMLSAAPEPPGYLPLTYSLGPLLPPKESKCLESILTEMWKVEGEAKGSWTINPLTYLHQTLNCTIYIKKAGCKVGIWICNFFIKTKIFLFFTLLKIIKKKYILLDYKEKYTASHSEF